MISPSQRPLTDNTHHSQHTDINAPGGIQTHNLRKRATAGLRLRPRCHGQRLRIYKASPKRYRTFEIARQGAAARHLRRWCCVAGTLSFILTLATSRHFQLVMSYTALSERVFSALGDFGRGEDFSHPLRRLHFCFNIVAVHPRFINCYDIFQKVFISIRTI